MYYEEKIVNGVLCFRTTPHTPFVEFSKEKLTAKIGKLEQKLNLHKEANKIDPDKTLYDEFVNGFKKTRFGKAI